jgi:succinate-semialdehyde dehydrogenase/glutarate-semialdehyde dehydrogenase
MTVAAPSEIRSVNPATGELRRTFPVTDPAAVEAALTGARAAFEGWRERQFSERAVPMRRLASVLRENAKAYASLITAEMGKPITQSIFEIEKCAGIVDHFATNAERLLSDEPAATSARRSLVAFEPLGVILGVMPWNYPFLQVIRFASPALSAGNAAIIKHASNVPECSIEIEGAFRAAGFPDGLLTNVLLPGASVEPLVLDRRISAVSVTGSSATGGRVAALAASALKKSVLELGGSDPFLVLADADLDLATAGAVRGRTLNSGQSCIAAKRFVVSADVAETFERQFAAKMAALRVGDPQDPACEIGPLAREDLVETLDEQVRRSVAMGARVVTGGRRRAGRGWYYEPTVLADVTDDMPVMSEETFGPVAAIRVVRDVDEAIQVANASNFGLGASVWTRDEALAERIARRIEAGIVYINAPVASDPRVPFGGVKNSGYGRELSAFGIREFTNVQTIWIAPSP